MRINHNISAMNTHRLLGITDRSNSKTLEKLSSGKRINRAGDDAAGMAISEKMRAQIRGLTMASRNSLDGISLVQTSEGGMNEIHSMLQRMRELSVQAANGTLVDEDREAIQSEIEQLSEGIDSIAKDTDFNGIRPLNKNGSITHIESTEINVDVQPSEIVHAGFIEIPDPPNPEELWIKGHFGNESGANWPDILIESPNGDRFGYNEKYLHNDDGGKISITDVSSESAKYNGWGAGVEEMIFMKPKPGRWKVEISNASGPEPSTFKISSNYLITAGNTESEEIDNRESIDLQVGANTGNKFTVPLIDATIKGLDLESLSVMTNESAEKSISTINDAIENISLERSRFGAYQNRLEHTIKNLDNTGENLTSAMARIEDADMALEMSEFQKLNVLQQAGISMLAQANQQPQSILQLLS